VEVLDPLCPACRSFEERLEASALDTRLERKLLLFPLDDQCNWMVDRALHPGACTVSEAVLCADGRANEVLSWAFSHQHEIKKAAKDDPKAAARMVREKFPQIGKCVGSPQVQAELNQALRWAVRNQLPVLTPQLYVEGTKLCDADTDLGMDYMLTRLAKRAETGEEGS
jgi:protein-disulfide isomerase